jgi:D-Tyr-tRNAtyr deacylase
MKLLIHKKKNSSGDISIHIVDRTNRGYKVVKSLGSSKNEDEIKALYQKTLKRVNELENNLFYTSEQNQKKDYLIYGSVKTTV